jgi:hypothetical protein
VSPDTRLNMYVMPCDLGMSVSGGVCIGTRTTYTWATASGLTDGTPSQITGATNTATLVASSDGDSPFPAAVGCHSQTFGGHSDWYLPALSELSLVWVNLVAGVLQNGFTLGSDYWSSSEVSPTQAWAQNFNNNANSNQSKTLVYYVRCARKG